MSDAPEKIWATEDSANFGEDRFHTAHGPMKGLTEYTRSDLCITRAEADAMVAAERERCAKLANDQAQVFRDEAHDQMQLGHREMHKRAKMIASFFDAHASAIRAGREKP